MMCATLEIDGFAVRNYKRGILTKRDWRASLASLALLRFESNREPLSPLYLDKQKATCW